MTRSAHKAAFAAQLRLYGEAVCYLKDGSSASKFRFRALRGQTNFREQSNQTGSVRIVRSTDFIFDPTAFRDALGRWPEDGELLTVETPTEAYKLAATTYRVSPFNGEPVYRLEATFSRLRIHCQEYSETC